MSGIEREPLTPSLSRRERAIEPRDLLEHILRFVSYSRWGCASSTFSRAEMYVRAKGRLTDATATSAESVIHRGCENIASGGAPASCRLARRHLAAEIEGARMAPGQPPGRGRSDPQRRRYRSKSRSSIALSRREREGVRGHGESQPGLRATTPDFAIVDPSLPPHVRPRSW